MCVNVPQDPHNVQKVCFFKLYCEQIPYENCIFHSLYGILRKKQKKKGCCVLSGFLWDCQDPLNKIAEVEGEIEIEKTIFKRAELILKLLQTPDFSFIYKKSCTDKLGYLQNTTNFGPRICENHVSKLLSKEYAASRGCHNPKCIGSLKNEHQVFEWDLKLETPMSPLNVSCQNCRHAPLGTSELLLFNRMCDRLVHGLDLPVASISNARSVKSLNLGQKLHQRTIAVLPKITKNCIKKSLSRRFKKSGKSHS